MGMELVEHIELVSAASVIEFANIPQTGKDLIVELNWVSSSSLYWMKIRTNNVYPSNHYNWQYFNGSAGGQVSGGIGAAIMGTQAAVNAGYNYDLKIIAQGYTQNTLKGISSIGTVTTGNGLNWQYNLVASTAKQTGTSPMTSMQLKPDSGNFPANTIASLYIIS